MEVLVHSVTYLTPAIFSYELRPENPAEALPAFTAGAHIDLTLGNGLIRSYSLLNSQVETHRYLIAVQKDRESRGGSAWIHKQLHTGDVISIAGPRNNFQLNEEASRSIFIAGGIGVTPIRSMVQRLADLGRQWTLHYCARTRKDAAFTEAWPGEVHWNFDSEAGGKLLDIRGVVRSAPLGTHFYCCGPTPMLAAFEEETAHLPREQVHVEYFQATRPRADQGGFSVALARSGLEVTVPMGRTILESLLDAGIDVSYSCMEGICGTCETGVLEGIPDHRDLILTREEQVANRTMIICCSGCKSERLVLDL